MHLGLDEKKKANEYFSLIVYTLIGIGVVLAPAISRLLGASEEMLPYCVLYLRINMIGVVFFMLQNLFQNFLSTAEKPRTGFAITLIAGCTNMLLDWILVGICDFGIAGAAWATVTSQIVGGTVPFIYFMVSKFGILKLTGTRFDANIIAKTCGNGVSEFLSNLSESIVGYDQALNELTVRGMRIYSVAFLVMGFNVFASAILQLVLIYVLPMLLEVCLS